ncbi:MAG: ABC transporter permease subunit, partial [Thermococcus sp.]
MKVSKWSERLFGTPLPDPVVITSFLFPLLYLVAFLVIPVIVMLGTAFEYNGHLSLYWFKSIFGSSYYFNLPHIEFHNFRPHIVGLEGYLVKTIEYGGKEVYHFYGWDFGVVLNSILVSISVMVLTTLLGTFFAFIMARYDFPGKNIMRVLLFIPLLVTPFVNVVVVKKMFLPDGIINWIFYEHLHLFPKPIWIDGLVGVIIAQTITYYPIVYLNAYASFINIDPSLEEQAENLGSRGFHLFRKVTLPLSLPGIMAGAAIVFIFSMEDLAAPLAFRFYDVMSVQILLGIKKAVGGSILPETAALALLLLILATAAFAAIRRYVTLRQYAMV